MTIRGKYLFLALIYLLSVLMIIASLIPVFWAVLTSLKNERDLFSFPVKYFVKNFTVSNYVTLFVQTKYIQWFYNTVIVSVSTTLLAIIISSLGSYSLSRFDFGGKQAIMQSFLTTQMLPGMLLVIPMYLIMRSLGLFDSLLALIFAYSTFAIPFCLWMLKGYFDSIPVEIEECAMIDGCSRVGALFRIVYPLAAPGIAATGIFAWILAWNEFLFAVMLVNSPEKRVLTVGIESFIGDFDFQWGMTTASGIVTAIPVILLFAFIQKQLITGLTAGAVKA